MLYAIVAVLVIIADQWLKYWVTANIVFETGSREFIPGFLRLVNIHNDGATLNMLSGARWFFVVLAVVFTAAVIVALAKRVIRGRFGRWMAVLVLAGAVGNCIDRALFGYVVDMFRLEPKFLGWFGIFNVADIFITVSGVLFCFYLIFGDKKPKAVRAVKAEAPSPDMGNTTRFKAAVSETYASEIDAEAVSSVESEPEPARRPAPKHGGSHERAGKPAPRHEARRPEKPSAPNAGGKPQKQGGDMDFSLDDIMDEFK